MPSPQRAVAPSGAAPVAINSARTQIDALSAPQSYSPLADLFSTTTSIANQQLGLEKANQASGGFVQPNYWSGLLGKRIGSNGAVVNS